MKKFLFIPALCLLFASCGGDKGPDGGGVPSLKVEPSSLDFAAVSAPSQSVTVTAVNVEWEVRVSDTASAWLKAEKTDGTTVTVSVTDNGTPEQRTGSFTVVPTNSEDVKAKSVTVVQTGSDVEYKFSVEPASLTFEAEGAAAQTVTITAEGGLTWEAKVEGDAASWITVTPGEGTLEVKVSDNPETAERSGNIVVTPSAESVGAKAIRVTQAGKVFPPSLSIDVEDPETGLKFRANGEAYDTRTIMVTAVNTDWSARAVDADGNALSWFKTNVYNGDGVSNVSLEVTKNETFEERVGYVLITATAEEVADIRVTVTQDAALEHLSTLTGNVDAGNVAYGYANVNPNQDWAEPEEASSWQLYLYSDGIEESDGTFSGTGIRLQLDMASMHMGFNDDNEYYLADGTYEMFPHDDMNSVGPQMTFKDGFPGYFEYQHFGSWVFVMEDGEVVEKGPLVAGTVAVSRNGEAYTFTFDFQDDMGYTVTGTATVEFSRVKVLSMPVPKPPIIFD